MDLGSFDDAMLSTGCEVHHRMLQLLFGDSLKTAGVTAFEANEVSGSITLVAHFSTSRRPFGALRCQNLTLLPVPSALHNRSSLVRLGVAKTLDRHWIDGNLLRRWKRSCDKLNYNACKQWPETSGLSSTACPSWLIDTWRMCLVRGSIGVPYVALSYVWGQETFFKNTQQTLAQLQLDGALIESHRNLGVPRAIADAIAAVALLEERYLWVDALCVVQDDDITRHAELSKMAYIFAGASIAIIAAQGEDANYGLRGLRSISQPRSRFQDIFKIAKGYNIVVNEKRSNTPCLWTSRGWTYQEHRFARRCLYFEDDGVRWSCKCSSFHEHLQMNLKLRSVADQPSHVDIFSTPFPSLDQYCALLRNYNTRNFTHPQDALPAFAGITTSLSWTFYGGFICGLPLMFLDIALCWQPYHNFCERRLPSEDKEPTELGLPSWSWVGWRCELDPWAWYHGDDYVKISQDMSSGWRGQHTLNLISWFSRKWGTKKTIAISYPQSMVQERKTSAMEGNRPPLGWERFNNIVSPVPLFRNSLLSKSYFYKHERDPNSEFWYPIPSWYDTQEAQPINAIDSDTLLCARTKRAWLWLKGMLKATVKLENVPRHMVVSIRDNQGKWVGALRLQTPLSHQSFKDLIDSEKNDRLRIGCYLSSIRI